MEYNAYENRRCNRTFVTCGLCLALLQIANSAIAIVTHQIGDTCTVPLEVIAVGNAACATVTTIYVFRHRLQPKSAILNPS